MSLCEIPGIRVAGLGCELSATTPRNRLCVTAVTASKGRFPPPGRDFYEKKSSKNLVVSTKPTNFALAFRDRGPAAGSKKPKRREERKSSKKTTKNLVSSKIRRNFAKLFRRKAGSDKNRTLKELQ